MLKVDCYMCEEEINKEGAILYAPPIAEQSRKIHLCKDCYSKALWFIGEKRRRRWVMAEKLLNLLNKLILMHDDGIVNFDQYDIDVNELYKLKESLEDNSGLDTMRDYVLGELKQINDIEDIDYLNGKIDQLIEKLKGE